MPTVIRSTYMHAKNMVDKLCVVAIDSDLIGFPQTRKSLEYILLDFQRLTTQMKVLTKLPVVAFMCAGIIKRIETAIDEADEAEVKYQEAMDEEWRQLQDEEEDRAAYYASEYRGDETESESELESVYSKDADQEREDAEERAAQEWDDYEAEKSAQEWLRDGGQYGGQYDVDCVECY